MKTFRWVLFGMCSFMGVVALVSGATLVAQPDKSLGMANELLKSSPFVDYRIPGLLLSCVIGGLHVLAAAVIFRRNRYSYMFSGAAAIALIVWIFVQVLMIGYQFHLQPLCFSYGIVTASLSGIMLGLQANAARD